MQIPQQIIEVVKPAAEQVAQSMVVATQTAEAVAQSTAETKQVGQVEQVAVPQPITPPQPTIAQSTAVPPPSQPISPTSSLFSLSDALTKTYNAEAAAAEPAKAQSDSSQGEEQGEEQLQDGGVERKIIENKQKIVAHIERLKARYKPFFERMLVSQNTITIEVPSKDIADDVRRVWADNQFEIAGDIGVVGRIVLEATIKEEMKVARPIRLDDRIIHFGKLNPDIQKLVAELELIAES